MTLAFYILWTWTLFVVLTAPIRFVVRKLTFFFLIIIGIWLLIGVSTYQSKHVAYELRRIQLQGEINRLYDEKRRLEDLLAKHPTSRDVLFSLGELSYRLHDQQTLEFAIKELERLDPNNPKLEELRTKQTK